MHPLTRSLIFHLLMPCFVHLALVLLVIRNLTAGELAVTLLLGGWIAMLGIAVIGSPKDPPLYFHYEQDHRILIGWANGFVYIDTVAPSSTSRSSRVEPPLQT